MLTCSITFQRKRKTGHSSCKEGMVFLDSIHNLTDSFVRAKFENQALVFVKSPSRNCWKRPSECIWQAPVALRCKSALKDQYSSSDLAVLNLIQSILGIKDASVTEYISDLEILSKTSDCSRDDVESLYKSIELQWKPEMEIR
jgi:hypothetical protein